MKVCQCSRYKGRHFSGIMYANCVLCLLMFCGGVRNRIVMIKV
nr:MAG TPA: hypothetical protein [Bacteriophage sp.]